jgi:hypothetical protein
MVIIFHFIFEILKNPIMKLELNRIFKNVVTCTRCQILQNGLHVDAILFFKKFKLMGTKRYLCIIKLCML